MLIRLLYHESKITLLTLFFDKIQQKSRHLSRFFFLNFPRYRPFFAYFLQNKNFTHFFPKIPYYRDLRFWKSWNQNFRFFLTPFFAVFRTFLPDIIGVFWPKKTQDICTDILFFLWYPFVFLLKSVSAATIAQKKKGYHF